MKRLSRTLLLVTFLVADCLYAQNTQYSSPQRSEISGIYHAILEHQENNLYQYAKIILRESLVAQDHFVTLNVQVFFGDYNSSEFLVYEFKRSPIFFDVKQINLTDINHDINIIGTLKDGIFSGDWYSILGGKVGSFFSQRDQVPAPPEGRVLVEALSGNYRGSIQNKNPQSNLPERLMVSFVSSQDSSDPLSPRLSITGNSRFYLGDFDSLEYVEIELNRINFNHYNRFLTAKTAQFGFTFKGSLSHKGSFDGELFSDGLGYVGNVHLNKNHRIQNDEVLTKKTRVRSEQRGQVILPTHT